MKMRIEEALCIACGLCREVCPEAAIHPKLQDIHHMYEIIEHQYCPAPGALIEYDPTGVRS